MNINIEECKHQLKNGKLLNYFTDEVKDNDEIVAYAIKLNITSIAAASKRIQNDFNIMKPLVFENGNLMEWASLELKDNKELAKIALNNNGKCLIYLSDRLKADEEIIRLASSKGNLYTLEHCPKDQLHTVNDNYELALFLLQNKNQIFGKLSYRLRCDYDIAKMALEISGKNFRYMGVSLKDDMDLAMIAIKSNPDCLELLPLMLKHNKDIVKLAVSKCGKCLKYASENLQDDMECISLALKDDIFVYRKVLSTKRKEDPVVLDILLCEGFTEFNKEIEKFTNSKLKTEVIDKLDKLQSNKSQKSLMEPFLKTNHLIENEIINETSLGSHLMGVGTLILVKYLKSESIKHLTKTLNYLMADHDFNNFMVKTLSRKSILETTLSNNKKDIHKKSRKIII